VLTLARLAGHTQAPDPGVQDQSRSPTTQSAAIAITCTAIGEADVIDVFTAQTRSPIEQAEEPTE
jgi:hypothetical protein